MRALAWSIFAAISVVGLAHAAPRMDTKSMTCAQVKTALRKNGSAILNTGATTYGRYVANSSQCNLGQVVQRVSVPTRDNQCTVLRCAQFDLSPG